MESIVHRHIRLGPWPREFKGEHNSSVSKELEVLSIKVNKNLASALQTKEAPGKLLNLIKCHCNLLQISKHIFC